uniref:Lymphatic vessel endothelial hyaluronan receptor 1 n=1 Tax=Leptobrachium leishanense TaxID=445787 RepID=A0A8C5QJ99_9ANUR
MKMSHGFGFLHVLLSTSLWIFVAHSSFNITDLNVARCRFVGVVMATPKDNTYKFNFTTAESVCQQLELTLASKVQVQAAYSYGFETCSYGWVVDLTAVISRIHHNEKCGRNQTGVLTWTVDPSRKFHAYCFNASDTWKNSCKPEFATTSVPSTETQSFTSTELSPNSTSTAETPSPPLTSPHLSTTTLQDEEVTVSSVLLETETTPENQEPQHPREEGSTHNGNTFGSLPAALLTLALLFLSAAVVLGVCYVNTYKANLRFTKKEEEREAMEAKVFKENGNGELQKQEEPASDGIGKEDTPASAASTVNCVEATV